MHYHKSSVAPSISMVSMSRVSLLCLNSSRVELIDCLAGLNSPDTALYESLKLLCSLLVTLVGKGLYGSNGGSSEMRFIGQGKLVPDVNN